MRIKRWKLRGGTPPSLRSLRTKTPGVESDTSDKEKAPRLGRGCQVKFNLSRDKVCTT